MPRDSTSFLIAPNFDHDEYIQVTPHSAGWDYLSFAARKMNQNNTSHFETDENEFALTVVLGGTCQITSNRGTWRCQ